VEFSWNTGITFAEVIDMLGQTPLPPYLKREPVTLDKERYQTIYSMEEGAVAAPTAGLHFTEKVFRSLDSKDVQRNFLTLHVSAGTFQPIKTENAVDHIMHREQIHVTRSNIQALLLRTGPVIAVGTTSMRTLESLYWFGVRLSYDKNCGFAILQQDAYTLKTELSLTESMNLILERMDHDKTDALSGETSIYIMPGYKFRICEGLVTNFHQPNSTLILLVAAFIGNDWKRVYNEALENGYRFLSYGDSSLLLPSQS
jgi:S-adenosylmethionine:tRNA ribosyltransferase-isomerase